MRASAYDGPVDVTSSDLAARASRGDDGALGSLMARHLPGLRAYVRLRAGRAVRARESDSDLVQSAYREVLQDLEPDASIPETEFRQWLYKAALRKVIDRGRFHGAERRAVAREVDLQRDPDRDGWVGVYGDVATPSRIMSSKESIERIEAAFDGLDETQREVVLLARVVGLSHAEIAKAMDRTEQATRSLLSRALARLATLLDQSSDG